MIWNISHLRLPLKEVVDEPQALVEGMTNESEITPKRGKRNRSGTGLANVKVEEDILPGRPAAPP